MTCTCPIIEIDNSSDVCSPEQAQEMADRKCATVRLIGGSRSDRFVCFGKHLPDCPVVEKK